MIDWRNLESRNTADVESPTEELRRIMLSKTPPPSSTLQTPIPTQARPPLATDELQQAVSNQTATNLETAILERLLNYGAMPEDNLRSQPHLTGIYTNARKKTSTSLAPPLCSVCNHTAPEFGRPPRKFTYAELIEATDNFSSDNFLAEGGFGFVYKGRLREGQEVAVKQHKLASSQGDDEFCAEVEVLSCAHHRNLVTLIGYCVENRRRLLVYEFVCNGSLDWQLSARNTNLRHRIAIGAARGLRYLHEECRVGCIVHRDMRHNNILLTHDFAPMMGDFGLARWQPSREKAEETRVIGTLGYLAPEYASSDQITEKTDVFSFGVILLELITGRKAIDATRSRGETCLTDWARPLIQEQMIDELLDPRLEDEECDVYELSQMVAAAGCCICKDPDQRPKMSVVLRILEGAASQVILGAGGLRNLSTSFLQDLDNSPHIEFSNIRRQGSLDSSFQFQSSQGFGSASRKKSDAHSRESGIPHSAPLPDSQFSSSASSAKSASPNSSNSSSPSPTNNFNSKSSNGFASHSSKKPDFPPAAKLRPSVHAFSPETRSSAPSSSVEKSDSL